MGMFLITAAPISSVLPKAQHNLLHKPPVGLSQRKGPSDLPFPFQPLPFCRQFRTRFLLGLARCCCRHPAAICQMLLCSRQRRVLWSWHCSLNKYLAMSDRSCSVFVYRCGWSRMVSSFPAELKDRSPSNSYWYAMSFCFL